MPCKISRKWQKQPFLQNQNGMAALALHLAPKAFVLVAKNIERNTEYKMQYDFPNQMSGEGRGLTVCEYCMGSLAACLTQTIIAHATSRGIQIESCMKLEKGFRLHLIP
jgi:hypothetical protein